jgi:hypothetical protein
LYAIVYPKEYDVVWDKSVIQHFDENRIGEIDEFERIFELWSNPLYLEEIFNKNKFYLQLPYWKNKQVTLEELPRITKRISTDFECDLTENKEVVETKFQRLDNKQT